MGRWITIAVLFWCTCVHLYAEPGARRKSPREIREEKIAELEAKYGGKVVLAAEFELTRLDGLVRFFDFDELQTRYGASTHSRSYFEDYLADPRALAALSPELRAELTQGLRVSGQTNLAEIAAQVAPPQKPANQILDGAGNPVNGRAPTPIVVGTLEALPAFATNYLGGITGISGGLLLPDSPLLSPDYAKLKERWVERLRNMTSQEIHALRLEYLSKPVKAKIALEHRHGSIQLKQDLPEYERRILENMNWSGDLSALEFRHTVPYTSVRDFVEQIYAFADLTGTTDLLENPGDRVARSESFHIHAMPANAQVREELAELRSKQDGRYQTCQERQRNAAEVEGYLAIEEESLKDSSEQSVRRALLEDKHRAQLAPVEMESGRTISVQMRWIGNYHVELKAHSASPEDELVWLLPGLVDPASEANPRLADQVQDQLTPEVAAHLADKHTLDFIGMVATSARRASASKVTLNNFDWHWLDGASLDELVRIGEKLAGKPAEIAFTEYVTSPHVPGRAAAWNLLHIPFVGSHTPVETLINLVTPESAPFLLNTAHGLDFFWNLGPEQGKRPYQQRWAEVVSHLLIHNPGAVPDLLGQAANFYSRLTEEGRRAFAVELAKVPSDARSLREIFKELRKTPEAFFDPEIARAAVRYLRGRSGLARSERLWQFVAPPPGTSRIPGVVAQLLGHSLRGSDWDSYLFETALREIRKDVHADEFLEVLRTEITDHRDQVEKVQEANHWPELDNLDWWITRGKPARCRANDWSEYGMSL